MLFSNKQTNNPTSDFSYLKSGTLYFDSACQTLRPERVIKAEMEYYHEFNACGHRVKYEWGKKVDSKVDETRELLLSLSGKSSKEYSVAFTLNTTYGINLILSQLKPEGYKSIVTSSIEHNSAFLPTITYSKKHGIERKVLDRAEDGSLIYTDSDIDKAIVVVNTTSNIDGRELVNIKKLSADLKRLDGLLLLDSAQTFGHNSELLKDVEFDASFGSSHKMYGPSLGFIIFKKELLKKLDFSFIGGGTVTGVRLSEYDLVTDQNEMYAPLEPGLQNFAGIIGLGEAIKFKNEFKKDGMNALSYEKMLSEYLFSSLKEIPNIKIFNTKASGVTSIYSDSIDGNRLAVFLSEANVMCRSGYFCCHYHLTEKNKYPPLLRISMGLNNTKEDIDSLISTLNLLIK